MLLSKEELNKSAEIHPDIAEVGYDQSQQCVTLHTHCRIKFMSKLPPQNFDDYTGVREGLRIMTEAVIELIGPPPPGTKEFFHDIPMSDGYTSSLKIHKPAEDIAGPLIVLCFGGGFIAGDNNQMSPVARALVGLFDATVVNISYRLAPEYKFPQGPLDAIDSLKWIAENATGPVLAADPAKGFILGGVSAGACITASVSRRVQEDKLAYPLTGQWLNIPPIMDLASCPEKYKSHFISPGQNADAPVLPKAAVDMMAATSGWDMSSDLRCAVLSKTPISGQPRTYFQVCGMVRQNYNLEGNCILKAAFL